MGKNVHVKIISHFKSDIVWKLLKNNNLTWCQICSSIENASNGQDKSSQVCCCIRQMTMINNMQCKMKLQ